MDGEEPSQRLTMLGKPGKKDLWLGLPAGQFGQAILPVDQLDRQRWGHRPSRAR